MKPVHRKIHRARIFAKITASCLCLVFQRPPVALNNLLLWPSWFCIIKPLFQHHRRPPHNCVCTHAIQSFHSSLTLSHPSTLLALPRRPYILTDQDQVGSAVCKANALISDLSPTHNCPLLTNLTNSNMFFFSSNKCL